MCVKELNAECVNVKYAAYFTYVFHFFDASSLFVLFADTNVCFMNELCYNYEFYVNFIDN